MSNLTDRLGGARASLAFKAPCRVATTASITLSGYQTIDGVALASTDADNGYNTRVLVKNQDTASQNGIYEPATGAWSRAKDCDGSDDIRDGTRVFVAQGTTQSGGYVFTTDDPVTIGASNITIVSQSTVDVSFGSLDELTVVDPDEDSIVIVDASAGATKRVELDVLNRYNSNGTIAAPAIAFESDADLGIYRVGANELGFSVGGAGTGLGLSASVLYPVTSDAIALGTSSLMFSDLFLASGAVINFNAGDVTVTHSANALAFAGVTGGYTFDDEVNPTSSDGAALGTSSLMWSDLFLASGAVINFNNGNYTLTHSAGAMAFVGGPLTAPSFIPSGSTIPTDGMYLPASNTLGWAINSAGEMQLTAAALAPISSDGLALGTSSLMWSDLFLASGAVINFNAGDVTVTHSANALAFAGVTGGYTFDDEVNPTSSDGAALGTTSLMWSDLFLASGGVINWNNGNAALTHSSGAIAVTGTLDIQQGWKLSGDYSDTWSGSQDNYNGGGDLANITLIRVDGGASSRDITGMTGGSDGLIRIFQNVGATNDIVLKSETTSTAENRFSLGADVTLTPSQGAILRYDGTLSRWTAVGVFTTAGGGAGTVTSVQAGFGMNFGTITSSGAVAINAGHSGLTTGAL
jgi:hypothetical protein